MCTGCQDKKTHQLPYYEPKFRARQPLEPIHSYVFGPVKQPPVGGARYMVTFIDDYSRYSWVYFMKEKSETFGIFKSFKEEVEQELGRIIRHLRIDAGGEYMSREFSKFLRENRIQRQLTCTRTPQQMDVAQNMN